MTLRLSSTNGRALAHVEPSRADELPAGLPGPARPEAMRDDAGRFVPGPGTAAMARVAGKAAGESKQLAALLGLWTPPDEHEHAPYYRLAREWRDDHMAELAATVGGGSVGPGPASVVSTAALELAASRFLFDQGAKTGDAKMLLEAARLADASRQNLLAAHELTARAAAARPKRGNALLQSIEAAGSSVEPEESAAPDAEKAE